MYWKATVNNQLIARVNNTAASVAVVTCHKKPGKLIVVYLDKLYYSNFTVGIFSDYMLIREKLEINLFFLFFLTLLD